MHGANDFYNCICVEDGKFHEKCYDRDKIATITVFCLFILCRLWVQTITSHGWRFELCYNREMNYNDSLKRNEGLCTPLRDL